jgi:hypothetical protein
MDFYDRYGEDGFYVPESHLARMRAVAGDACLSFIWHGYLVEDDRSAIHFGALCQAALSSRLKGALWFPHLGVLPATTCSTDDDPLVFCPDCQRESELLLRQVTKAEDWTTVEGDDDLSSLFYGSREEIRRIKEELFGTPTAHQQACSHERLWCGMPAPSEGPDS